MKICIITTVLAVGFAVVANADQAANGCAAGLSSDGPMICSNTAGMDGTLFRDAARRAAEAAGQFPEP